MSIRYRFIANLLCLLNSLSERAHAGRQLLEMQGDACTFIILRGLCLRSGNGGPLWEGTDDQTIPKSGIHTLPPLSGSN